MPRSWREGSAALGVNRWRTIVRVSLRTARPAIVAATVLATARALGEAIMLSMVSGGRGFAANPLDGITFLFEPVRPLAATIVQNAEGLTIPALAHTMYAIAAVLLGVRGDALVRRLGGEAAAQALRDPRLMAAEPLAPAPLAPPRARRHAPATPAHGAWPLIDRIGYWLCWATGVALCRSRSGSSCSCSSRGSPT